MKSIILILAVSFSLFGSAQPIYVKVLDQKTGLESWMPYVYSTTITATGVSQQYVDSLAMILQTQILAYKISVNGKYGNIILSKNDVGLNNVDNTSDLNKPVSASVQNAFNNLSNATPPSPNTTPPSPTNYILDRFPNNTLLKTETGQSWTIKQGGFSINNGNVTGATKDRNIATLPFAEPFTMQAEINTYTQTVFLNGFVIRYVDPNNYYMVKDNQDGNGFRIYERVNGVDNLLVFATETLKGTLNVVVNNNKIIATIGSQTLQADMTKFSSSNQQGIIIENTGNALSNFIMWQGIGVQPPNPMNAFILDYPSSYQVYQRNNGMGIIKIKGAVATQTSPVIIEARFNNGTWNQIADNVIDIFSGELNEQPQGQGNLDLRIMGTTILSTIPFVGIGDNYIVYGQSNATGHLDNLQTYSNPTLKAGLFGNDYKWKELVDPFDNVSGQVDNVSNDAIQPNTAGQGNGSYWLPLATKLLASTGVPVAFIPCTLGGRPISEFLPSLIHDDRNTLYGSMVTRARTVFGIKAVLFHQGESDAIANTSNYKTSLKSLSDAIFTDLGIKIYIAQIHWWDEVPTVSVAQVENINAQMQQAVVEDNNILLGADMHKPIDVTRRLHLDSDAAAQDAAGRWWNILK